MKSPNSEKLEEVIKANEPFLSRRGFSLHKHTFNRTVEPGLTHVIDFGMGQVWSSYHGKFTVDVGIFIDEAFGVLNPFIKKFPRVVSSAHCEIIRRLPALQEGVEDRWWDLHSNLGDATLEVNDLLLRYGIPFLDSLDSRQAIIAQWSEKGNSVGFFPRGRLVIAIVHKKMGDDATAKSLVLAELEENMGRPSEKFVREVAGQLNLGIEE